MSTPPSFFQELKRRNVIRVAIGYIVLGWLVMQVADVVLNNIAAPGWVFQVLLLFLALGLPFAIFFAWAFEITPEGVKRQSEVDRAQSITHLTGQKLDYLIIGILAVALGYFMFDRFVLSADREVAAVRAALDRAGSASAADRGKSIAVLPFVNMSSDPEQEYFSDGLSEELLNLLAKIPDLQVASRSSAFQFKGEKIDLMDVAQKLNVAHVLEGSVRKSGDQVRVTAQLIRADNGYHMWSETYDRPLNNIFAIQDEISAAVVDALRIELLGEAPRAHAVDPEAYALMLKGRFLHAKWGKENFEKAVQAYKQALEIDPDYAEAWAGLSVTYLQQTQGGYIDHEQGLELTKSAVRRALEIDPGLPGVWARLALIQALFEWDWDRAVASIDNAMNLDPNSPIVLGAAATVGFAIGEPETSLNYFERALTIDPLDLVSLYNRAESLYRLGRYPEAEAAARRLLELNPEDWGTHALLTTTLLQGGRPAEARLAMEQEVDPHLQEFARILVLHAEGHSEEARHRLQAFTDKQQGWASSLVAVAHATMGQTDEAFAWLEKSAARRESLLISTLRDPLLATLHADPRWKALLTKMGLKR